MISVSKVLRRLFPMSADIPPLILERARQRGIAVHEWIDQYHKALENGQEEPTIALEYLMYADFYKAWVKRYNVEILHSELKLYDDKLVGVIDTICKINDGEYVVMDYKLTSKLDKKYVELQTSAYKHLAEHNNVIPRGAKLYVLHMNKQGWSFIELEDRYEEFKKIMDIVEYLNA